MTGFRSTSAAVAQRLIISSRLNFCSGIVRVGGFPACNEKNAGVRECKSSLFPYLPKHTGYQPVERYCQANCVIVKNHSASKSTLSAPNMRSKLCKAGFQFMMGTSKTPQSGYERDKNGVCIGQMSILSRELNAEFWVFRDFPTDFCSLPVNQSINRSSPKKRGKNGRNIMYNKEIGWELACKYAPM